MLENVPVALHEESKRLLVDVQEVPKHKLSCQWAEVAVLKKLFRSILERIRRLRPPEAVPG